MPEQAATKNQLMGRTYIGGTHDCIERLAERARVAWGAYFEG
jgi:hypothetical protein